MFKYPKSILNLIESFSALPGVGKKSAERFAFYVLDNMSNSEVEELIYNLEAVKNNIKHCSICGNISEDNVCEICNDKERNHEQVLVVESVRDVLILEKLNEYKGIYHVLNGSISFQKGITTQDLFIEPLLKKAQSGEIKEVILATNATLEGETTARYIKELLNDYPNIKVSRIAYGLPVGSDLIYADQMTLLKALEGRQDYK